MASLFLQRERLQKANSRQQNLISQALEEGLIDQKDAGRFAQYRFGETP